MSKQTVHIKSLPLAHTKAGMINVAHIEKPYGEYSSPVTSISVSLEGEEWKVHIPYENLDALIDALIASKEVCSTFTHEHPHMELASDTGGGQ